MMRIIFFLCFIVLLNLTVFSQVQSCNLLSFFNLLLVGLNLHLELINKLFHPAIIFLVLIILEAKFNINCFGWRRMWTDWSCNGGMDMTTQFIPPRRALPHPWLPASTCSTTPG